MSRIKQLQHESLNYKVFDDMTGEVYDISCSFDHFENLVLSDDTFHTIVVNELNKNLGKYVTLWIDTSQKLAVQIVYRNDLRKSYLCDPAFKNKIKSANLHDLLLIKSNKQIAAPEKICYMRVCVVIETMGEAVNKESLNSPGQKFTGKVNENRIEGIFEIEHKKYDGTDCPAFPADYSKIDTLAKYLEPELLIESNDTMILNKARKITSGSSNCWDAACLLSMFVSDIRPGIPGGISARGTMLLKEAECGGHSRLLAALCRAVGIPARLSVGCMYVNDNGGIFGQHVWTEIFMGNAGWIPVDATADEIDFIDSGHIRLGEQAAFLPKKMKILEYRCTN